jgi:hypothetical protein
LAFSVEFQKHTDQSIPAEWKNTFQIEEIDVPEGGDFANHWHVSFFIEQIDKNFTAIFEDGKIKSISVD